MVTDRIKANAIALYRMGDSPRKISDELEIPYMLVKEWTEDLPSNDMIQLSANVHAVERVVNGQVLSSSAENLEMLKTKIEETAIKIVEQVNFQITFTDPLSARALNLLADTCAKLYSTIVTKAGTSPTDPTQPVINMLNYVNKRD